MTERKKQITFIFFNHLSAKNALIFVGKVSGCRPQHWLLCVNKTNKFYWVNNYLETFLPRRAHFNKHEIQWLGPLPAPSQLDAYCI